MFTSYDPIITNAVVLESISEARKWHGIHLYLDVPDNEKLKGQKFLTAMHDMSKTESGEFEYRVLFRPMDDNPAIAVGLEDDTGTFAMEVGVSQSYAYGALRNNKNWNRNDRAQIADNYYLQKGEYYVMNMKLKTPYGPNKGGTGIINEVEFMVNGMVASHKPRFESDDLLGVARYLFYHASTFDKIEVLEHHFRYNGITKSLAPHPTEKVYNIFSYNNIFQMTYGGCTVIRGKFQNTHASIKGVGLMAESATKYAKRTLENTKDVSDILTITVLPGLNVVFVKLLQDTQTMKLTYEGYFGLNVSNIDIENVEVRRGLPPL